MTSFTERFGGSAVNPSDVGYLALAFSVDTTLVWPAAGGTTTAARLVDATPAGAGLSVILPDARQVSNGYDILFSNRGGSLFTLKDSAGSTLGTLSASAVLYLYLKDNSTAAGVWGTINFGTSTSTADAATLAGLGLRAVSNTLQGNAPTTTFSAGFTISSVDREKAFVWTGGTGTVTCPLATTLDTGFSFEITNQGTGTLTLAATAPDTIDGSATITLQATESARFHSGTGAWYSVGRGRNASFSFTLLVKAITGGTVTLTPTEASNVVQQYTGALLSNAIIVLPGYVQVYYVANQTSGAFSVTFKTAGVGTTVVVPQGQNAVLFCDGTNVYNSSTTVSGISSLTLNAGSAASPSINYTGDGTTGYFQPLAGTLGAAISGVEIARYTSAGLRLNTLGVVGAPAWSFVADTNTGLYSTGADTLNVTTGGVLRTTWSSAGNVTIAAPGSGTTLALSQTRASGANSVVQSFADSVVGVQTAGFGVRTQWSSNAGATLAAIGYEVGGTGTNNESQLNFYTQLTSGGGLLSRMVIGSSGNVTIAAPSSGTALTVSGLAKVGTGAANPAAAAQLLVNMANATATNLQILQDGQESWTLGMDASSSTLKLKNSGADRLQVTSIGNFSISAPSGAGVALTVTPISGSGAVLLSANFDANLDSTMTNSSNTGSANTRQILNVAGGAAGDPSTVYQITAAQSWATGIDNSDSDAFVISASAALGTSNRIRIATTGVIDLLGSTSGTVTVNATGQLYGSALHNNVGAVTGSSNQYIASGTYTATFTNTTNITTSTIVSAWTWERVGNVVTVSGDLNITPTAAGACELRIGLPIASTGCFPRGTGSDSGTHKSGRLTGNAANNASFFFTAASNAISTFAMIFQYEVF